MPVLAHDSVCEVRMLAPLTHEARGYRGEVVQVVNRSEQGGRGFDVFVRTSAGRSFDLSDRGADTCGQPSLAADRRRVLLLRAPRY